MAFLVLWYVSYLRGKYYELLVWVAAGKCGGVSSGIDGCWRKFAFARAMGS